MYLKHKLKSNDAQNCFRIRTVNSLPAWNFWLIFITIRALQTKLFHMKNTILCIAKYSKRKGKEETTHKIHCICPARISPSSLSSFDPLEIGFDWLARWCALVCTTNRLEWDERCLSWHQRCLSFQLPWDL